jgi:hypothetical protein
MPLYLPTAIMEPCTLAEAPQGSVFIPFGQAPIVVGEVDQHDIGVRLGGDTPFSIITFSRDERSNVRGVIIGRATFEADPTTAFRARDGNCAPGDLIIGKVWTSIVATHEDGTAFEVAILGDPQRGPEAGFGGWRLKVAAQDGNTATVFERCPSPHRPAANSNH